MSDAQQHIKPPELTDADKAWIDGGYDRWFRESMGYLDRKKGFDSGFRAAHDIALKAAVKQAIINMIFVSVLVAIDIYLAVTHG